MYSFLVLGIIPGTNIQITFDMWLQLAELAIVLIGLAWGITHSREVRKLAKTVQRRLPLHATQLHLRAQ